MPTGRLGASIHGTNPFTAQSAAAVSALALGVLLVISVGASAATPHLTIWSQPTAAISAPAGTAWTTAMSTNGNYLYAGSSTGILYSFSGTGTLRWQVTLGSGIAGVSTDGTGNLVAVAAGANFYLFNSTGSQLWNFTIGGVVAGGSTSAVALSQDGNMVVGGAVGPAGSPTGEFYAIVAATGLLYFGHGWGKTYMPIHAVAVTANGSESGMIAGNGYATGGTVELFNATGFLNLYKTLNETPDSLALTSTGARVFIGTEGWNAGEVLVFNVINGHRLWYYAAPSDVYCLGILAGGKEVTFTTGSDLYTATVGSGIDWTVSLGGIPSATPNAHGNDVVVGDHQQEIAAGNLNGTVELLNTSGALLLSVSLAGSSVASMSISPTSAVVWVGTSTSVMRISGT